MLELEFCLIVGTLSLGATEFEDFAFVVVCATGCDGFFEVLTRPVLLGPVRLDARLDTAFAGLGDRKCLGFPKELLTDIFHTSVQFGDLVDEPLVVF